MPDARGKVCALVVLPIEYNPDEQGNRKPVEDEKLKVSAEEISKEFDGAALYRFEKGQARGFWWDKGILFKDELAVVEAIAPDSSESREWIRRYARDVLRPRFDQKAICIKFVGPIELMIVIKEEIRE